MSNFLALASFWLPCHLTTCFCFKLADATNLTSNKNANLSEKLKSVLLCFKFGFGPIRANGSNAAFSTQRKRCGGED